MLALVEDRNDQDFFFLKKYRKKEIVFNLRFRVLMLSS